MKPINEFSSYNKDNILGNMLQAETHLKCLDSYSDPDFASCVNKHLLESQAELSELTAHDPENADYYRKTMNDIKNLRKDNINLNLTPDEAIKRLREIRGSFEKKVTGHNVEECKACGDFEERLDDYLDETKGLNRGTDKSFNMNTTMKALVGSFVGKGISEVTSRYVSGSNFGIPNRTLVNLGVGLGIDLLYLKKGKKILPAKMETSLVSAANFLIADEVGDLVAGYIPAAARMAPVARIAPTVSIGNSGVPQFANGKHIYVD